MSSSILPKGKSLSDILSIGSRNFIQIVVNDLSPFSWHCFIGEEYFPEVVLEDLLIDISLEGGVKGYLCCIMDDITGNQKKQILDLFPSVVDIRVLNYKLSIACSDKSNIDTVCIYGGVENDGLQHSLENIFSLRVLISSGLVEIRLKWMDGREEILPLS